MNKKGFEDIGNVIDAQQGIFDGISSTISGSSAMEDYSSAKTKPTQEGYSVTFMCENCGKQTPLMIEYPELIAIKYGLQPQVAYQALLAQGHRVVQQLVPWGYDQEQHSWFPALECRCRWPMRPLINLGEAEAAIRAALARGWLPQQVHDQLSKYCFGLKQQAG